MGAKIGEDMSKLGKIGQYAKEGAATGALLAGAETPAKAYVNPEQTVGDHFKRIGVETAGAAITPLAHGLMNAVQHLRKTKGTTSTSNVSDDVMRLERQQRELTNNAVEEQALQDTRIRTEPESLPIQAASESAPSLEQALESVAKQKRKLLQMENFLMTYKRCAMHLRLSNPLWRQMGVRLRIKVAR